MNSTIGREASSRSTASGRRADIRSPRREVLRLKGDRRRRDELPRPAGGALKSDEFSGGEHGAKAKLEELGFEVVPRPALAAADTLPLREALAAALAAQQTRAPGEWSDDLQKAVAVTLPNAIRAIVGDDVPRAG